MSINKRWSNIPLAPSIRAVRLESMTRLTSILLLIVSLFPCLAQIRVDIDTNQDRYLAYEDIYVYVTISNFSGRDLLLGESEDWLSFYAKSQTGHIIRKEGQPEVKGAFIVKNSHEAMKVVSIVKNFDFSKKDQYMIQVVAKIPGFEDEYVSNEASFFIVNGVKLWEQVFGLPQSDPNQSPELRKYSLYQATQKKKIYLYFRLSDPNDHYVYRVYPIGTMLSFSEPQAQLDGNSHLHVLNQFGARSFAYYEFSPLGEKLKQQTYQLQQGRKPKLGFKSAEGISVYDGVRVPHQTDFPKDPSRFPNYLGKPLKRAPQPDAGSPAPRP